MSEKEARFWEESWSIDEDVGFLNTDDGAATDASLLATVPQILDSVTRIGGEVCRLRAEVDGLLEQNAELLMKFSRIVNIIEEKGVLNMEDFDLACDVLGAEEGQDGFAQSRRDRH